MTNAPIPTCSIQFSPLFPSEVVIVFLKDQKEKGEKLNFVHIVAVVPMNDIIQVLPDSIANQIAAGEVIQRPASVIKELVENAIDAGAKNIRIEVEDAGKALIRVTDDGCGMSPQDARMAFERHATSKIRRADDLLSLRTMGFRGEALASIASVSHVMLTTRRTTDELGVCIQIDGGIVEQTTRKAAPVGSCFEVRNLFYNVPARRRFLKSDITEWRHILSCFERIALVYPDIAFYLYQNGIEASILQAGTLAKRIAAVVPKPGDKGLLSIDFQSEVVTINGFIGSPEHTKQRGAKQFLFVNGRFMKHPYFHHAIIQAYEALIPVGQQPTYFVYLQTDPSRIDVNVHPTKTEIKFLDEQAIYRLLGTLVKQTLHRAVAMPRLDFDTQHVVDLPTYRGKSDNKISQPTINRDHTYNPFSENTSTTPKERNLNWATVFSSFAADTTTHEATHLTETLIAPMDMPEDKAVTSSGAPLILTERYMAVVLHSGMAIIDAKRAEMRINYEELIDKLSHAKSKERKQRLIIPRIMHFNTEEAALLDTLIEDLDTLGFEVSPLGDGSFSLLTTPSFLNEDGQVLIENSILELMETEGDGRQTLIEALARSISIQRYSAPYKPLSPERAEQIVAALFALPEASYTPTGKLILHLITNEEIASFFA